MVEQQKLPFQSFRFSLIEWRQPRCLMTLTAPDVEATTFYSLSIVKGSASNPLSSIKREIPLDTVNLLRDSFQNLGVFSWEESYGDSSAPGSRRWDMTLVFQKDVFSITAKGGSDTPPHFSEFLEELYRLDFPRPAAPRSEEGTGVGASVGTIMGSLGINSMGSMSSGDLGAYAATKGAEGDLSYLKRTFGPQGVPDELKDIDLSSVDAEEMRKQFLEAQRNPEAFQTQMKEAYKHLSAEEKSSLLTMLAQVSGQTREWWRRLLES